MKWKLFQTRKKKKEDNIVKGIKKFFRFRKKIGKSTTKAIRKHFRLKKENKTTKNEINTDITLFFEQGDDYYKPVRVGNFWNNNCIEYESYVDKK